MLGQEQGKHLVRRREDDGHEGAERDDAIRIQRRPHGREAALGNDAEHAADERTGMPRPLDGGRGFVRGEQVEKADDDIGSEQERDELRRVLQGVDDDVEHKLHENALQAINRVQRQWMIAARTSE